MNTYRELASRSGNNPQHNVAPPPHSTLDTKSFTERVLVTGIGVSFGTDTRSEENNEEDIDGNNIGAWIPGDGTEDLATWKRKLRLEQNRLSAKRSRKRQKIMLEELQRATLALQEEQKMLLAQGEALEAEIQKRNNRPQPQSQPIIDRALTRPAMTPDSVVDKRRAAAPARSVSDAGNLRSNFSNVGNGSNAFTPGVAAASNMTNFALTHVTNAAPRSNDSLADLSAQIGKVQRSRTSQESLDARMSQRGQKSGGKEIRNCTFVRHHDAIGNYTKPALSARDDTGQIRWNKTLRGQPQQQQTPAVLKGKSPILNFHNFNPMIQQNRQSKNQKHQPHGMDMYNPR